MTIVIPFSVGKKRKTIGRGRVEATHDLTSAPSDRGKKKIGFSTYYPERERK